MAVRRSSPPQRLTVADVLRIGLGALMIPLGITILLRTLSIAVTLPGLLIGVAFVAFGLHRLWLGWHGYQLYRRSKGTAR